MKLYLCILLGALLLISCNTETTPNKADIPQLDSTDYEIISAAIEELKQHYSSSWHPYTENDRKYSGNPEPDAFIINDSTDLEYPLSDKGWFDNNRAFDSLESFISKRLKIDNSRKYMIDNTKIPLHKTYKIFENAYEDFYYEKLYAKFPDAWAIVGFSKPAYSQNNEKAAIYIFFSKNGKGGRGMFMWFRNENGKWIIYETIQRWIS